jgi:hypothetical protein
MTSNISFIYRQLRQQFNRHQIHKKTVRTAMRMNQQ